MRLYIVLVLAVLSSLGGIVYQFHYKPLNAHVQTIKQRESELKHAGDLISTAYVKLYRCQQSISSKKIEAVIEILEVEDENSTIDIYNFSY